MKTKRINLKLDLDVLHALIHALEPEETFDECIARFLRIAFKGVINK